MKKHLADVIYHGTSGYLFTNQAKLYLEKIPQSNASLTLERIYPSSPEN